MAYYRKVSVAIWHDPDFLEYEPVKKIMFIYFFTNPSTNESGIYIMPPKVIADNTGTPLERVMEILAGNQLKNIAYDVERSIVFVKNYRLYNGGGRPNLIALAIQREYKLTAGCPFWKEFIEIHPEFRDILTVGQPLTNGLPTVRRRATKKKGKYECPEEIQNIKVKWDACAKDLLSKGIKGMIGIRDPLKADSKLDGLIDRTIKKFENKPEKITAAIENYFKLWLVPADKRAWKYGLWSLTNFLERGDGENILRFADYEAVLQSFTTIKPPPPKSERQLQEEQNERERQKKFAADVRVTVSIIRSMTAKEREDFKNSCADLYTQNVFKDALHIVQREENEKKAATA